MLQKVKTNISYNDFSTSFPDDFKKFCSNFGILVKKWKPNPDKTWILSNSSFSQKRKNANYHIIAEIKN